MSMKPKPSRGSRKPDDVTEAEHYVLGGGHIGEVLAKRLSEDGYRVALVDDSYDSSELPGQKGDPAELHTLKEAGLSDASTVLVVTQLDRRNLLIAQLVRTHFDVSRILVLSNIPERDTLFEEAGHEPVSATTALSDAIVDTL